MTSVERILDYTKLDQEAAEHTSLVPAAGWPSKGDIHFENVRLYYEEDSSPALWDLTFSINTGEKVSLNSCQMALYQQNFCPVSEVFQTSTQNRYYHSWRMSKCYFSFSSISQVARLGLACLMFEIKRFGTQQFEIEVISSLFLMQDDSPLTQYHLLSVRHYLSKSGCNS